MDFELTDEQQMVQEMTRSFAARELAPVVSQMDRDGVFPEKYVKELGKMGLMGVFVPAQYGGAGMDLIAYVIALEEISKFWASLGTIMSVNNSLVCGALLHFGNEEQKQKYLVPLARGELLGCYALTEPGSGSDAGAMQSRARRAGNDYLLN